MKSASPNSEELYEQMRTLINEKSHCAGCSASALVNLLSDLIVCAPRLEIGDQLMAQALRDIPDLVAKNRAVLSQDDRIGRPVGRA